jgi:anti-sigma factor RsiW
MALHFRSDKRVAAYYWVDKEVAYAVSGPANRDRLETITKAIYDQIDKANVRRL